MESAIQDLVNMRDKESLYEVMTENDDWMLCLDAAEGLVLLGDERGVGFLEEALESDDEDIASVAREILEAEPVRKLREQRLAQSRQEKQALFESAKKRLAQGGKVYQFKTIYLNTTEIAGDEEGNVAALEELGLDGWQVAAFVPPAAGASGPMRVRMDGGYLLLQKEIRAEDAADFAV